MMILYLCKVQICTGGLTWCTPYRSFGFSWTYGKRTTSFRHQATNAIGSPNALNPRDVGFPTTATFNFMEDFKSSLHSDRLKTDLELITLMRTIKQIHDDERALMKLIRKRSYMSRAHHKRTIRRTCPSYRKTFMTFQSKLDRSDAIDCALRGCSPIIRNELKRILTNKTAAMIYNRARPTDRERGVFSRPNTVSHPNGEKREEDVVQQDIICKRCFLQKVSSVDQRVIPTFWIRLLVKLGRLCVNDHVKNFGDNRKESQKKQKKPQSKNKKARQKSSLPFEIHETAAKQKRKLHNSKIRKVEECDLVRFRVGLKGIPMRIERRGPADRTSSPNSPVHFLGYDADIPVPAPASFHKHLRTQFWIF